MDAERSTQDPGTVAPDGGDAPDGASTPQKSTVERLDPPEGASRFPGQAPKAATIGNGNPDFAGDEIRKSADRSAKACVGRTKDGRPCGIVMTALDTDGTYKCRFHRDRTGTTRPRPPVTSLRTMEDVAKLTSWAAVKVAAGSLSQSQALAIKALCSEWRMAYSDGKIAWQYRRAVDLLNVMAKNEQILAAIHASTDPAVRTAFHAWWAA